MVGAVIGIIEGYFTRREYDRKNMYKQQYDEAYEQEYANLESYVKQLNEDIKKMASEVADERLIELVEKRQQALEKLAVKGA